MNSQHVNIIIDLIKEKKYEEAKNNLINLSDKYGRGEYDILLSFIDCKFRNFSKAKQVINNFSYTELSGYFQFIYGEMFVAINYNNCNYNDVISFFENNNYPKLSLVSYLKYFDAKLAFNDANFDYVKKFDHLLHLNYFPLNKQARSDLLKKENLIKGIHLDVKPTFKIEKFLTFILLLNYKLNFCNEHLQFNEIFETCFFVEKCSKNLCIILSEEAHKYRFYKQNFVCDRLFVTQKFAECWYLLGIDLLAKYIVDIIDDRYEEIIIIGASKSATGAIILSHLLECLMISRIKIKCNAFSPIIDFTESIPFPSYRILLTFNNFNFVSKALHKFINIKELIKYDNFELNIIYGKLNDFDSKQALQMRKRANLFPVNIKNHNSISFIPLKTNMSQDLTKKMYYSTQNSNGDLSIIPYNNLEFCEYENILANNINITKIVYNDIMA